MLPNSQNSFTVREMALAVGKTERTVRFYEEKGIIGGEKHGGRRYYDENSLQRLRFALHAKEAGFLLNEIRTLLDLCERSAKHERLSVVLQECRKKSNELIKQKAEIERQIRGLSRWIERFEFLKPGEALRSANLNR